MALPRSAGVEEIERVREAAKILGMHVEELAHCLSNARPSPSNSSEQDEDLTPGPAVVQPEIVDQEPSSQSASHYDETEEDILELDRPGALLQVNDQNVDTPDNKHLTGVFSDLESAFNDLQSDDNYKSRGGSVGSSLYQFETGPGSDIDELFRQPDADDDTVEPSVHQNVEQKGHRPLAQDLPRASNGPFIDDGFNPYETRLGNSSAEPWNSLAPTTSVDNPSVMNRVSPWEKAYEQAFEPVESASTTNTSQQSDPSWVNLTPPATAHQVTKAMSSSPTPGAQDTPQHPTGFSEVVEVNGYGPTPVVGPARPEHLSADWVEATQYDSCSNTWYHHSPEHASIQSNGSPSRKRSRNEMAGDDRPRGCRFENEQDRENAKLTRKLNACIRCRYQKITCKPDPEDPNGPCLTCKKTKRPTAANLPCMRYKVTESSVYRYQDKPFQVFSRRWQSMDLVDITEWASPEVVTVEFTQIFLEVPIRLKVREFIPKPGDMLHKQWQVGEVTHTHEVPHYAIANLEDMKEVYQKFVEKQIGFYFAGMIGYRSLDELFKRTYGECLHHQQQAKTIIESNLLHNTQKLWVACRMTSHPHHLVGTETLGGQPVRNKTSPWHDKIPMPPVMVAQNELLIYSQFLQPLSHAVLRDLQKLIYDNKRVYWYTIYLVLFMLMHSCSMITRRDEEYAKQINSKSRYANPTAIDGHHSGAQTMLAHFHYINKGDRPFVDILNNLKCRYFVDEVGLTDHQADFVRWTALHVQSLEPIFNELRTTKDYGKDFYWVAQLYDTDWRPHIFVD